jgi:hypothetical protein
MNGIRVRSVNRNSTMVREVGADDLSMRKDRGGLGCLRWRRRGRAGCVGLSQVAYFFIHFLFPLVFLGRSTFNVHRPLSQFYFLALLFTSILVFSPFSHRCVVAYLLPPRPALLFFPTFLFGFSSRLHLFPYQRSCRRLWRCRVGWVCLHPVPFFLPRPCYTLSLLSSAFRTLFFLVHPIISVFSPHSPLPSSSVS